MALTPTPCDNLPISFACEMFHYFPSLPFISTCSSSTLTVEGLTTDPEMREVLLVVVVVGGGDV